MKNIISLLFIFWIITANCQTKKNATYCIKISPIGNSDVPLDTLYITTDKLYCLPPNNRFSELALTDKVTMDNLIVFIESHNDDQKSKRFTEFGCNDISILNRKEIVENYKLNHNESLEYFKSLIALFNKKTLDKKLEYKLKDMLNKINY